MGNIPNHPMVVHFPIVLSIMLPIFSVGALWVLYSGRSRIRAWAVPMALAIVLFGSAFVATRTGEQEEERVENVVPETFLHEHEEAAERFLVLAGIMAGVAVLGLARGVVGSAARLVATAGSLIMILAGYQVGKAGGELVYEHNAGAAYASSPANGEARYPASEKAAKDEDDD